MVNNSINPNAIVVLFKFIQNKAEYLNDFKNGNLYFSSLQYFIKLEENNGNHKTGDIYEGSIHQNINDLRHLHVADFEIPVKDVKSMSVDHEMPENQKENLGICSFFAVQYKDLEKENSSLEKYRLKSNVLEDLYRTKDGDRVLFAVNNVSRLMRECRKKGLDRGLVKYYDSNNINNLTALQRHKGFCKLKKYRFQHEFRIEKDLADGENFEHLDSIRDEGFMWNILKNYKNKSNYN